MMALALIPMLSLLTLLPPLLLLIPLLSPYGNGSIPWSSSSVLFFFRNLEPIGGLKGEGGGGRGACSREAAQRREARHAIGTTFSFNKKE
jgi:hypothetical protein